MREMRILAATGQLGHGIPRASLERGLQRNPHILGADMGSIDPGPYYLGCSHLARGKMGVRRDLEVVLDAQTRTGIPLIIGNAGTAGGNIHVDLTVDIIAELAKQHGWKFRLARIHGEISQETLLEAWKQGKTTPLGGAPELDEETIRNSSRIVAQMGIEPFIEALDLGADVIIAGRACDTSIFSAAAVREGFDRGLATHMGKILECVSQCAVPAGRDAMLGTLRDDHFEVDSQHPDKHCTPLSVAAHSLYEEADPFAVHEPGGWVDLSASTYEAVDHHVTRVSGSRWVPSTPYKIKLEGVRRIGFRSFTIGAVRDPFLIRELDQVVDHITNLVQDVLANDVRPEDYQLKFRVYGRDGVLGRHEPNPSFVPQEAVVIVDAVGATQDIATMVCSTAKQNLLHCHYEGIRATGGNLAIPFSPDVVDAGEVFEFSVHHLMEVEDPAALANVEIIEL